MILSNMSNPHRSIHLHPFSTGIRFPGTDDPHTGIITQFPSPFPPPPTITFPARTPRRSTTIAPSLSPFTTPGQLDSICSRWSGSGRLEFWVEVRLKRFLKAPEIPPALGSDSLAVDLEGIAVLNGAGGEVRSGLGGLSKVRINT